MVTPHGLITWPPTPSNTLATVQCPRSPHAYATRFCHVSFESSTWQPDSQHQQQQHQQNVQHQSQKQQQHLQQQQQLFKSLQHQNRFPTLRTSKDIFSLFNLEEKRKGEKKKKIDYKSWNVTSSGRRLSIRWMLPNMLNCSAVGNLLCSPSLIQYITLDAISPLIFYFSYLKHFFSYFFHCFKTKFKK